ncbi:MAG: Ig-like domain-containing protein [Pseudomonadota bacterium]
MFKQFIRIIAVAAGLLSSVGALASPVVALTAPASNTRHLPPAAITLTADASDPVDTIARVDFYAGTTLIGTAASAPYTVQWSEVPTGTYTVTARAVNSRNVSKTSGAIKVIVNTPPTVTLTAPLASDAHVGLANINLAAKVNDADGTITKVQFYRSGTLIGTATTPPYVLTWANAPPGTYRITARATDNLGSVITSEATTITVANPVTVAMTGPATNTRYLPTATIPLGATASDANGTITHVDFYAGATLIGTATTAPYAIEWSHAPVGKHVITARATDSQGLSKTSSAIRVIVNTPPTVSLTAPLATDAHVGLANITLAANVSDNDGTITKVQFYRNGTLIGTATTAPFAVTWANAAPGTYRITARATDDLGSVIISEATTITVANPITVALVAPASKRYLPAATIELAATATGTHGAITQVDFFAGTTLLGSSTSTPYGISWSNVPAGIHSITAKATDSQGLSKTSAAMRIVVDAAPTVALSAPANLARYAAPAVITLAADVADSDGTIAKVQFFNGSTLLATLTAPPYTHDWQAVAKGSYTLRAKATDNLGVVTTSAAVTVQVADNATPVVNLTAPANAATYPAGAPIDLAATATDADGSVAKVEFFDGDTLLGTATQAPYTWRWNGAAAGSHVITAKVTDNAGAQATSANITITVAANVAPTVSMIATPTDATAPATVLLNAAAGDADGSVIRVEFFSGDTLLASVSAPPYVYNWMNVTAGTYTITAKATDDRGAVTVSEPVTVTVTAIPAAAQVYYIDSDHLNTPRVITDATNNIVWQWGNSDPFGGNLPEEDPGNTGNRLEFNLRFPGQYFDKETGLHYNYRRTYDPSIGRYVESDPIGLQGGINTYAYVEGNPIAYYDPRGLQSVSRTLRLPGLPGSSNSQEEINRGAAQELDELARRVGRAAQRALNACLDTISNWFSSENSAPFLPNDPYSPENVDRRRSELRDQLGTGNSDPDSAIPDRGPGRDMGGHDSRGSTPHETGERNVNSNEEHSRRPKGNPTGRQRR